MMNERQRSSWLTAVLGAAALGSGLWAVWPSLFPSPQVPSVTRTALPLPDPAPAAQAASTSTQASVQLYTAPRVRLNSASQAEIESLPGIGPALAGRIMAARPLRSLADLDAVKGIGPKLLTRLTPLVQIP